MTYYDDVISCDVTWVVKRCVNEQRTISRKLLTIGQVEREGGGADPSPSRLLGPRVKEYNYYVPRVGGFKGGIHLSFRRKKPSELKCEEIG